jgi:hypothetical protein
MNGWIEREIIGWLELGRLHAEDSSVYAVDDSSEMAGSRTHCSMPTAGAQSQYVTTGRERSASTSTSNSSVLSAASGRAPNSDSSNMADSVGIMMRSASWKMADSVGMMMRSEAR